MVLGVRGIGCRLAFVAGAILIVTSGVFRAMAQPVEGLNALPETVPRAGRSTEANLEAEEEFKSSGAVQRRVPCDQVISQADHDSYVLHHAADLSVVARELDTSAVWVERCMLAYGREVRRPSNKSAESKEQLLESLEEDEPEERGREEIEEPGPPSRKLPEKQLRQPIRPTPESQLR